MRDFTWGAFQRPCFPNPRTALAVRQEKEVVKVLHRYSQGGPNKNTKKKHTMHGSEVWASHDQRDMDIVERVQHRATKMIKELESQLWHRIPRDCGVSKLGNTQSPAEQHPNQPVLVGCFETKWSPEVPSCLRHPLILWSHYKSTVFIYLRHRQYLDNFTHYGPCYHFHRGRNYWKHRVAAEQSPRPLHYPSPL